MRVDFLARLRSSFITSAAAILMSKSEVLWEKKEDIQGDPNRNFLFQIAVSLKRSIFDPSLVKPKCVLGVADFFQFSAVCLQFSAVCLQFPKKSATLQTHFGLYNMGSNIHSF